MIKLCSTGSTNLNYNYCCNLYNTLELKQFFRCQTSTPHCVFTVLLFFCLVIRHEGGAAEFLVKGGQMSSKNKLYKGSEVRGRILGASACAVMTFIGVCHELVGQALFPFWNQVMNDFTWHALGISVIVTYLCLYSSFFFENSPFKRLCFPVSLFYLLVGIAIFAYSWIGQNTFHSFAFSGIVCLVIILCVSGNDE